MMSTLFFGGVIICIGIILLDRRGSGGGGCLPSEKRTEQHDKIGTLGGGQHVDHFSPPFSKDHPYSGIYRMYILQTVENLTFILRVCLVL